MIICDINLIKTKRLLEPQILFKDMPYMGNIGYTAMIILLLVLTTTTTAFNLGHLIDGLSVRSTI